MIQRPDPVRVAWTVNEVQSLYLVGGTGRQTNRHMDTHRIYSYSVSNPITVISSMPTLSLVPWPPLIQLHNFRIFNWKRCGPGNEATQCCSLVPRSQPSLWGPSSAWSGNEATQCYSLVPRSHPSLWGSSSAWPGNEATQCCSLVPRSHPSLRGQAVHGLGMRLTRRRYVMTSC